MQQKKRVRDYLFQFRFLIAAVVFAVCVAAGLTGSSVGEWCEYFDAEETGVLFGESREIRSDEWATQTAMTWSQYYDAEGAFSYFSSVVRGCETDVFLEYGQPVASWVMMYRPFYLGYLFLPIANGMAFFWYGRLIALFLVSFEFGRLLTRDKRLPALAYAFLIAFAPVVQWWFAINGLVEMLIYIQLSIMALRAFMRTRSFPKRLLLLFVIVVCAGGYVLTMYPSWQIPLAYVLLALIVWTFLSNWKRCRMQRRDWLAVAVSAVFFLASMGYIFYTSWDTVVSLMDTVYPGARSETGGGMLSYVCSYISSMWLAITGEAPADNTCEVAFFIDLFPMCYVLAFLALKKGRKKDRLTIALLIVSVFLGLYCFLGFPKPLAVATMLSHVQARRALVAFGFCNILILIRSAARFEKMRVRLDVRLMLPVGGLCFLAVWSAYRINPDYYTPVMIIAVLLLFLGAFLCSVYISKKPVLFVWVGILIAVSVVSGGLVNPVRTGVSDVESIPELQMIRSVVEQDGTGLWVFEGVGYPYNNTGLLVGAPTINSTNVYPNIARWSLLDGGENEEIYNRYAHITVNIAENAKPAFTLVYADAFSVTLSLADLQKLDVKYVCTVHEFEDERLELIDAAGIYRVYRLAEG